MNKIVPIPNIGTYSSEMAKALPEKLWFLEYVWVKNLVEIGTADRLIPIALYNEFKHPFEAFVYEPNEHLFWDLKQNIQKLGYDKYKAITSYNEYPQFKSRLKGLVDIDVLVLSSVLHEVFDQGNDAIIQLFNLFSGMHQMPKHIAIRDMRLANDNLHDQQIVEDVISKIRNPQIDYITDYYPRNFKNDMLYLMKHRYIDNWEHEKDENYFSVDYNIVHTILGILGYDITYRKEYMPEFFKQDFKDSFGLEFQQTTTHTRLLYTYTG